MAIAFVQSKQGTGTGVTMTSAPTAGDLLIATGFNLSASPGVNVSAGWVQVSAGLSTAIDGTLAVRIAQSGDTTSQTPFNSGTSNVCVAEFSGIGWVLNSNNWKVSAKEQATANPPSITTTSITPTKADNVLIVACWDSVSTDTAPSSVTGMTITQTLSGGATGNGVFAYELAAGTSAITKTCTWTGSTTATSGAFAFAIWTMDPVSESGSITPAGTIAKQTNYPVSGSMTLAGVISKLTNAIQSGSITVAGTISKFIQVGALWLTGSIQAASNLASVLSGGGTMYTQSLSGSMTDTSGWGPTTTDAVLSGSITPAGSISRAIFALLVGSMAATGIGTVVVEYLLAGSITAGGVLLAAVNALLSGNIAEAGTLAKLSGAKLSGSITQSGTLAKQAGVALAGSVTMAGSSLLDAIRAVLAGSVTMQGNLNRAVSIIVSGSLTLAGTISKAAQLFFTGSVTESGSLKRLTSVALNGQLTSSGTVSRLVKIVAQGSVTLQGAFAYGGLTFFQSFTGSITPSGGFGKMIVRALIAAIQAVSAFTNRLFSQPAVIISLPIVNAVTTKASIVNSWSGLLPVSNAVAMSLAPVRSASVSLPVVTSITLSASEA